MALVLLLLNLFLFLAVAIQAVIYWQQLRVMRKQAESLNNQSQVMRAQLAAMKEQATVMQRELDAMAITERAYVVVETPRIGPVEIPTVSITADVLNAGRTPLISQRKPKLSFFDRATNSRGQRTGSSGRKTDRLKCSEPEHGLRLLSARSTSHLKWPTS
jgi:hypothetical protein